MKSKVRVSENVNPVIALGVHDSNLRLIERLTGVKILPLEDGLELSGDEDALSLTASVLNDLYRLARGNTPISHEEIKLLVEENQKGGHTSREKMEGQGLIVSRKGNKIKPKTANQALYMREIMESDLVFGIGPAGTGKTYLAIAVALNALLNKKIDRIILTRPVVEAGESLGFLPGTLEEKIDPYLKPLFDAIAEMLSPEELSFMLEKEIIELAPLAYMRGRTLSRAFIILDEAQNTTTTQMKMFLTRLGEGSKMVVTGDVTQTDLPRNKESGLKQAMEIFKTLPEIRFTVFAEEDIVRHGLVRKILQIYKKLEEETWQRL